MSGSFLHRVVLFVGVGIAIVLASFAGQWIAKEILIDGEKPGGGTSMSHGLARGPGILDDGDYTRIAVLPRPADIVTFSEAKEPVIGGERGDIIRFLPYGAGLLTNGTWVLDPEVSPPNFVFANPRILEHRALAWVELNQTTGNFDAPRNGLYNVTRILIDDVPYVDSSNGSYLRETLNLTLVFRRENVTLYPRGNHSGFITKGDYSRVDDQAGGNESISPIVKPSWIIGKVVRIVDRETIELVDQVTWVAIVVGEVAVAAVAVWSWRRKT